MGNKLKKGDVYWVILQGQGSVQKGLRPCVVTQNNVGNRFAPTTLVVPLTTRNIKRDLPTHLKIPKTLLGTRFSDSTALFEQVTTIDKQQIKSKIGSLPANWQSKIDEKLMTSFGVDTKKLAVT